MILLLSKTVPEVFKLVSNLSILSLERPFALMIGFPQLFILLLQLCDLVEQVFEGHLLLFLHALNLSSLA